MDNFEFPTLSVDDDVRRRRHTPLPLSTAYYIDPAQQQVLVPPPTAKRCKLEPAEVSSIDNDAVLHRRYCSANGGGHDGFPTPAAPSRILFYERGEWKDFCPDAFHSLLNAFLSRQSAASFSMAGNLYVVHFLHMLQLNLATGYLRSIAWIDANGKCCFPSRCVEGYAVHLLRSSVKVECAAAFPKVPSQDSGGVWHSSIEASDRYERNCSRDSTGMEENLDLVKAARLTRDSGDDDRSPANSSLESSVTTAMTDTTCDVNSVQQVRNFGLLRGKISRLEESEPIFREVKGKFVSGLGRLAGYVTVTEINENCHRSASAQARCEAFKKQEELTRKVRGDANVRYGWLAESKQGVCSAILYGFRHSTAAAEGTMYGVGVYLSPESSYSVLSPIYSDVEENGEQHVILCRAIMGNVESVAQGSNQFHPSSEDYDSGVDDLSKPTRYIVWSTNMNTHILPEYIVSFKFIPPLPGLLSELRKINQPHYKAAIDEGIAQHTSAQTSTSRAGAVSAHRRVPRSPWMTFSMLFTAMKRRLPAESMERLLQNHADFKAGRISRRGFIRMVRSVAGDELVGDCIRRMQAVAAGDSGIKQEEDPTHGMYTQTVQ